MKTKKEHSFYEVYRSLCFLVILIGLCLNFVSFAKIYQNKKTYTEEVTATITSTADMDVYKTDTEIYYLPTYEVKYHGKALKFKNQNIRKIFQELEIRKHLRSILNIQKTMTKDILNGKIM